MQGKYRNKFTATLAGISVLGLVVGALADFGIIDLNPYLAGVIALLLGFGLMLEGNIRGIVGMLKGKPSFPDIVHIVSGLLGLLVFVGGVVLLLGLEVPAQLAGILGFAKSVAVVAVVAEYFY